MGSVGGASELAPPRSPEPAARLKAALGSADAAIARTLRLPAATWVNDRDGDKVFDTLEMRYAAHPDATQLGIVTLVYGADVEVALSRAREVAGPFTPTHVFSHLGGYVAHLRLAQVLRIATLTEVRQVEWGGQRGRPTMDTAAENGGVRAIHTALDIDGDGETDTRSRMELYRVETPVQGRYLLRVLNLARPDVLDVDVTGADVAVGDSPSV